MLKNNFVLFFVILAAVCFSSCGGLFIADISGGEDGRRIRALPARLDYKVADLLDKNNDLTVCEYLGDGGVFLIPPEKFELEIPGNPAGVYVFQDGGVKIIKVHYNGLSVQYTVEVDDPYGVGSNQPDDVLLGGKGIVIGW